MASSTAIPALFPKSRLSASDFQPFSVRVSNPVNCVDEKPEKKRCVDERSEKKRCVSERPEKKRVVVDQCPRDDLNVFNFCPEQIVLDADDPSSSDDEESDEDDFQSKPSSSSGSTGRTSKNSSNGTKSTPNKDKEIVVDGQSSPKCSGKDSSVVIVKDEPLPARDEEDIRETFTTMAKAEIMSKLRQELFMLPGDERNELTAHESSEDENIIEAACGLISTTVSPKSKSAKPQKTAPIHAPKHADDVSKSKLLNCPVCGMVLMEKSLKLSDHYKTCHTPQRTDVDCLGFIPTHRRSDGKAYVRLDDGNRVSGHQCFVCYRICRNSRELRLHWQLHKVYVSLHLAKLAADRDALNTSSDHAFMMDTDGENDCLEIMDPVDVNVRLDLSEVEDNEFWNSDSGLSADEDDGGELRRVQELKFQQNALRMAERIVCARARKTNGVSYVPVNGRRSAKTKTRRRKRASRKGGASERKAVVEASRRCPGCDVMFVDAVTCSQHRVRDHETKLMYRCVREDCRQVFHHYQAYRNHHRHVHRQRAFICSDCNDHFSVYGQLMAHRRSEHRFLQSHHPNITCSDCLTSFTNNDMLKAHSESAKRANSHEMTVKIENHILGVSCILENQVRCLMCMAVFDDHAQFEKHIDDHFNKHYVCPGLNCGLVCENFTEFKFHFITHYSADSKSTSCPRCRKVSVDNTANRRHMESCIHHCRLCKKTFVLDEDFFCHFFKTHHWLILVCPFCYEVIPSLKDMVEHQKQYHLMFHAVKDCEEPRINLSVFDEEAAASFPDLVARFPDLACGVYGYVSLGTQFFPHWWKLPANERLQKRIITVAKRRPQTRDDYSPTSQGNETKRSRKTKIYVETLPEVKLEPADDYSARDDRKSMTGNKSNSEKNKKTNSLNKKAGKASGTKAKRSNNVREGRKLIVKLGRPGGRVGSAREKRKQNGK